MKKVITGVSLFILTVIFTTQASAQVATSGKSVKSNKNRSELNTTNNESSVSLAAVVFKCIDDQGKIRVHFENYAQKNVSVKLSYFGSVLHQETSQESSYRRKFDMQNLPLGDYTIEITNGKQVYAKKVTLKLENGARVLNIS